MSKLFIRDYSIELLNEYPRRSKELNLKLHGPIDQVENFMKNLYTASYPYIELPKYTERNGYFQAKWVSYTLKVNGEEITIATDGEKVRIMSYRHSFTEIPLIEDKSHQHAKENPIKDFSMSVGKEPFIKEDEMEL